MPVKFTCILKTVKRNCKSRSTGLTVNHLKSLGHHFLGRLFLKISEDLNGTSLQQMRLDLVTDHELPIFNTLGSKNTDR